MSDKERKKINEKTRKQQEAAARAKADALRDDDNVFDVSFEQQGAGGEAADSVVSATDIKVICLQLTPPMTCAHGILEVMRYMAAARGPASSCVVFGLQPRHVQNADGTACVASQSRGSQPACSR